ncbi:MAG: glycosyltransferase [Pseudanabaenaceae cyanobacterium bins.39]|nr:glycosyltransferase [Pseudanabaenaceae cyanobacterium bins.39]
MAKVSIIIPNYNREQLIGETIQNMLNQSLRPYEVIVIDDGSTDNSVNVIRSFGEEVTLIQQANQGPGAARNKGLAIATGDYIQFMDSDDLASVNKLEVQVEALEKFQADMAYSPWAKAYIHNQSALLQDHILQKHPLPDSLSVLEWFLSGWSTTLQTCLFSRKILQKVIPFRTDLMIWEDGDLLARLFSLRPKIIFVESCLTLYRLHNCQKLTESGSSELRRLQDKVAIYPNLWQILNNYNSDVNWYVRLNFGLDAWQLSNAIQEYDSFSIKEINQIRELWQFYPSFVWYLLLYFKRAMIRFRWQITGSRWTIAYRSGFPSMSDRKLIENMGLKID